MRLFFLSWIGVKEISLYISCNDTFQMPEEESFFRLMNLILPTLQRFVVRKKNDDTIESSNTTQSKASIGAIQMIYSMKSSI
jgi:undecaprenyl pyrophosphate synthase